MSVETFGSIGRLLLILGATGLVLILLSAGLLLLAWAVEAVRHG